MTYKRVVFADAQENCYDCYWDKLAWALAKLAGKPSEFVPACKKHARRFQ